MTFHYSTEEQSKGVNSRIGSENQSRQDRKWMNSCVPAGDDNMPNQHKHSELNNRANQPEVTFITRLFTRKVAAAEETEESRKSTV